MAGLGIWLAAIAVGDLVAGLSGQATNRTRRYAAWFSSTSLAFALALLLNFGVETLVIGSWTGATIWVWLWSRSADEWTPEHATRLLAGVTLAVAVAAVAAPWVRPEVSNAVEDWLAQAPYDLSHVNIDRLVLLAGTLLFLVATTNALVRVVLALVGSPPETENELRGGRMIGPLERILMFGILSAGSLVAAGLVVTAKGFVRYPELNRKDGKKLEAATEYFLVGSLASWLVTIGIWIVVD